MATDRQSVGKSDFQTLKCYWTRDGCLFSFAFPNMVFNTLPNLSSRQTRGLNGFFFAIPFRSPKLEYIGAGMSCIRRHTFYMSFLFFKIRIWIVGIAGAWRIKHRHTVYDYRRQRMLVIQSPAPSTPETNMLPVCLTL